MTHNNQPQMKAWLYEINDETKEVRVQIDKKHSEFNFLKNKAREVGTIYTSRGDHIASLFQMTQAEFRRYYPKFEFLKERATRVRRIKEELPKNIDITDDLLKFLLKKAQSKSEITKKFKNFGRGLIDVSIKKLVKDGKLAIIGVKKAAKYKTII
jgi:hypothetical protein